MLVARLKNLNTDVAQLDELMELVVGAKGLRAEYESRNVAVPEWLTDALNRVNKVIDLQLRDDLEKRLREARARRASLLTPDEKRRVADEEIQKLESALGIEPAKAGA